MARLGILKFSLDTLENHLMGQNPFYYPNSDTLDEKNICKLLADYWDRTLATCLVSECYIHYAITSRVL